MQLSKSSQELIILIPSGLAPHSRQLTWDRREADNRAHESAPRHPGPGDEVMSLSRLPAVLFAAVALASMGFALYLTVLSPDARAAHEFFERMPVDRIESVVLEPVPGGRKALITRAIVVTRPDRIRTIATLVHGAAPVRPNHPLSHWAMVICFESQGREFSGRVVSTSNQGVLFYYGLGAAGGPVYGTYRQDGLGTALEEIVAEQER